MAAITGAISICVRVFHSLLLMNRSSSCMILLAFVCCVHLHLHLHVFQSLTAGPAWRWKMGRNDESVAAFGRDARGGNDRAWRPAWVWRAKVFILYTSYSARFSLYSILSHPSILYIILYSLYPLWDILITLSKYIHVWSSFEAFIRTNLMVQSKFNLDFWFVSYSIFFLCLASGTRHCPP
jgi:hypothetical protein